MGPQRAVGPKASIRDRTLDARWSGFHTDCGHETESPARLELTFYSKSATVSVLRTDFNNVRKLLSLVPEVA